MSEEHCISRARFLFLGFGALSAGVVARLAYVDLHLGPTFAAYAENRSTATPTIPAKRGTIYDRNGNVIATSVAVKDVSLSPREFNDRNKQLLDNGGTPTDAAWLAQTLAGLEGATRTADEIEAELAGNDEYYAVGKLHMDTVVEGQLAGVGGVTLADAYERQYPYGSVAGQVVGVIYEGDDGAEQHTGLESYYQDVLGGTDGSVVVQRGLDGQPIPGAVKEEVPVENGHDIVTTLDIDLQQYAESKVAAAVDEWSAKSGQFVVMDAETGEIYAIGSTPYVDPSDLSQANNDALSLKPVTSTAEPGSTFKVVTAAALLNEHALTPDTEISIPPALTIDDFTVSDSHDHGYETLTFRDIIVQSLNTGTVLASRLISTETLFDYIRRFGFLETSAVDYPGAASTIVLDVADWNAATAANVPFGQGISVSAVALVRALAAVDNEGTMCTPHLLLDQPDDAGASQDGHWETEDVIDPETCTQLNEILRGVVEDKEGTGNNAAVKGYTVAGKTGTAQKVTESGSYSDTDYVTSFIGWLPESECKLVCYVSLDSPQTSAGGGLVAGPVFSDIMSFVCDRYKVPPDTSSTAAGVPDAKEGAGL